MTLLEVLLSLSQASDLVKIRLHDQLRSNFSLFWRPTWRRKPPLRDYFRVDDNYPDRGGHAASFAEAKASGNRKTARCEVGFQIDLLGVLDSIVLDSLSSSRGLNSLISYWLGGSRPTIEIPQRP